MREALMCWIVFVSVVIASLIRSCVVAMKKLITDCCAGHWYYARQGIMLGSRLLPLERCGDDGLYVHPRFRESR